jgi:hypothetical protein
VLVGIGIDAGSKPKSTKCDTSEVQLSPFLTIGQAGSIILAANSSQKVITHLKPGTMIRE